MWLQMQEFEPEITDFALLSQLESNRHIWGQQA